MTGDLLKSKDAVLDCCVEQAEELITWLRSKRQIPSLISEAQDRLNRSPKAVIRAVITRWTAHYCAYRRLLELKLALENIADAELRLPDSQRQLIIGDARAKEKATNALSTIQSGLFWHNLAR